MNRVLVCCFNPRSVNNLHYGFLENGCKVEAMFIDWSYSGKTELMREKLLAAIDRARPDFIYSYGWWDIGIDLGCYLDTIKQKGILHAYWAYDDPVCFENISMPMAVGCDLIFTTVQEAIPEYKRRGIDAYLQPHGCYPRDSRAGPPVRKYKHDIVLLGHNYNIEEDPSANNYRINGIHSVVQPLLDNKLDVKVWGLWWTHWDRGYVLPEEYYGGMLKKGEEGRVYRSCKIALGLQTVRNSLTHLSARTFEALGCGVFHVSQYSPALETFFAKGIHMEWTKSAEETLEIVRFYLDREHERRRIACKGREEAYEKHTIVQRVSEVLRTVKGYIK